MTRHPIGRRVHAALVESGEDAARALARMEGQPNLFERVRAVEGETPVPSFLHSALCAMSLPVRRPADDTIPILRQDGQYTLAITPKPVLQEVSGQTVLAPLGVPYGSLPRLVLIHIMTEAVRRKSRQVVLGETFTDWMRRMGFRSISYGPRGSATLIRQQLDRLLACEWMIRWDGESAQGAREFGVKEIKLTTEYGGVDTRTGGFSRHIHLTEGFYDHLRQHAVPLNENAIRQLRDSATALDLYTWLAYRLPRVAAGRPATLTWSQLAVHFGNEGGNIRKFRQTVRTAWERHVSAVYPEARADFDTTLIRLHASPAPLSRKLVAGTHLALVSPAAPGTDDVGALSSPLADTTAAFIAALTAALGPTETRIWFAEAVLTLDPCRLEVPTLFKADWIRSRFAGAIEAASRVCGLPFPPAVAVRRS